MWNKCARLCGWLVSLTTNVARRAQELHSITRMTITNMMWGSVVALGHSATYMFPESKIHQIFLNNRRTASNYAPNHQRPFQFKNPPEINPNSKKIQKNLPNSRGSQVSPSPRLEEHNRMDEANSHLDPRCRDHPLCREQNPGHFPLSGWLCSNNQFRGRFRVQKTFARSSSHLQLYNSSIPWDSKDKKQIQKNMFLWTSLLLGASPKRRAAHIGQYLHMQWRYFTLGLVCLWGGWVCTFCSACVTYVCEGLSCGQLFQNFYAVFWGLSASQGCSVHCNGQFICFAVFRLCWCSCCCFCFCCCFCRCCCCCCCCCCCLLLWRCEQMEAKALGFLFFNI